MRFLTLILLFGFLHLQVQGQKTEYTYRNAKDSSYNCYLAIIPDSTEIKGVIIRDYSSLPPAVNDSTYPYKWKELALKNGLAIIYTVSSKFFPELYYNDSGAIVLDQIIHEAVLKYSLPKQNIFIGGISASGTRAVRYAQFCEMGKSKYGIQINGVFSVDSPLDFERFYNSTVAHKNNFSGGMLWEAKLMPGVFIQKFGGAPDRKYETYRKYSPFSYKDSSGGNARYLLKTSTIFFHEPDIDWWIKERGASYFDINSYDIAGLYTYLIKNKHKDVEMKISTGKGYNRKGERNCHSWSIVDEGYLIRWMLKRIK